jgi:hypothetical protein
MSFVWFRRITIYSFVAAVAGMHVAARGATPMPAHEPSAVHVPHFGKGGVKPCIPRARDRIRSVMNGDSAGRFDDQPRSSNSPCR